MGIAQASNGGILANGGFKSRRKLDFYPTPIEVTVALIDRLDLHGLKIWEPACGDGMMSHPLEKAGNEVYSSDIQSTCYGTPNSDYLTASARDAEAIITNPPFSLCEEFIRKAYSEAPIVCMLVKSQFWHAAKRIKLFKECPPALILALTWRPDFAAGERGGAPTMECQWVCWGDSKGTVYDVLERPTKEQIAKYT